jgi:hypothetical protein
MEAEFQVVETGGRTDGLSLTGLAGRPTIMVLEPALAAVTALSAAAQGIGKGQKEPRC